MTDIDDLIRYENEHTGLDFKAAQYTKAQHEALLKDILAMANADLLDVAHIVIGVKHRPDGSREFLGIPSGAFLDAAIYQQLVRENIEPDLHLQYAPHEYEGKLFGILTIGPCNDRPYTLKKAFGTLAPGDAFIRKGTTQHRLLRADYKRIYAYRFSAQDLRAKLGVWLTSAGTETRLQVTPTRLDDLPSERARRRISSILSSRAIPGTKGKYFDPLTVGFSLHSVMGGSAPYKDRSSTELQQLLLSVKEDYAADDVYEIFQRALQLQLYSSNHGDKYLEDASIRLLIPELPGLTVFHEPPSEPSSGPFHETMSAALFSRDYPDVTLANNVYEIAYSFGALKHAKTTAVFKDPPRLTVDKCLVNQSINVRYQLLGRNIAGPLTGDLVLAVGLESVSQPPG